MLFCFAFLFCIFVFVFLIYFFNVNWTVDVSVSSQNSKKLTVFVRSWEKVPHMDMVAMDDPTETSGNTYPNGNNHKRSTSELLTPRQQGSLYRLTMGFETETSCTLAAQHIEAKRLVYHILFSLPYILSL